MGVCPQELVSCGIYYVAKFSKLCFARLPRGPMLRCAHGLGDEGLGGSLVLTAAPCRALPSPITGPISPGPAEDFSTLSGNGPPDKDSEARLGSPELLRGYGPPILLQLVRVPPP